MCTVFCAPLSYTTKLFAVRVLLVCYFASLARAGRVHHHQAWVLHLQSGSLFFLPSAIPPCRRPLRYNPS